MLELIGHDMLEPVVIQNCVIFHAFVSAKGVGLYIRCFVSNINKEGSLGNRNRPRLFLNVNLQKAVIHSVLRKREEIVTASNVIK